jgi:fatty aldehyde-generating acyl-ACP reductase
LDTFAFIIHPIDPKKDIQRKYPLLGRIATDWMIDRFAPWFPPVYLSEVTGVISQSTGKEVKGWLIACPLTTQHFYKLPEAQVYRKIIETGWLAERLDAKILGLGAFTSVVGDGGVTIAQALDIPVTTGDAYTVAVAIEAVFSAALQLGIFIQNAKAAIVGATGAIGKVCAELLTQEVAELILISRHEDSLNTLKDHLQDHFPEAKISISTSIDVIHQAQIVLTVTSSAGSVIEPEHLRSGSLVCDVARPRDVAARVSAARQDVLVIDGGIVDVPGPANFHFNFGFPPGKAYACMAETIALALEGRFEDYTLGKNIQTERVKEIQAIAKRHGFKLSGFRSFERPVTIEQIDRVRHYALQDSG